MFRAVQLFVVLFLSSLFAANSQAADKLEVGYMPIISIAQEFVVLERKTATDPGLENAKLIEFQNGPAIVQALLAGQLDVAYLGIGPAMVARTKGADIKVVAASTIESDSLLALGDLAHYFQNGDASTAFARFASDKGRKAVITTFPRGSVPETVLQYWLRKQLKVDPDSVKVIYQGAAQVQQSLLTGAVDGASIMEPTVSIVTSRLKDARVVASGSGLFPDQPASVLVVREKLIREKPELVRTLVAAHVEATELLRNKPEEAAPAVRKYVGHGRLPLETVVLALQNSRLGFVSDPKKIIKSTQMMHDFQVEIGTLKGAMDVETMFDAQFFDQLK